ncbi:MAG: adenylate/guanylate cyclase domain-containing protein [Ahrensia sp.]|nr:adenylate/guanylate cyclase domain-containing protein [Ahrensia sp.]
MAKATTSERKEKRRRFRRGPAPVLNAQERFEKAERNGLRLAIFCRTVVVVAALVWLLGISTVTNYSPRIWGIIALLILSTIGVLHFAIIGSRYDRWWIKYGVNALDIAAICSFFVVIPISRSDDLPQIIAFRAYGIYFLFPFIVLPALSLSWRLVVWAGAVAVTGWWAAYGWVVSRMTRTLSWADIPNNATLQDYETVFLSIDFIGRGNRVQESAMLFSAALILALAVYRARGVFFAQIRAEAAQLAEQHRREEVTRTFGRFVPEAIVDELISDAGSMAPRVGHGTALVLDIANFTGFAAKRSPVDVIERLNDFLAWAADVIGRHKGVVISFTGDGLLATFNTPIELDAPEQACVTAAFDLLEGAEERGFPVRIGIASGDIASGSIGSENRTAFTVYGDTINRAARLESLCKELNRPLAIDAQTAERSHSIAEFQELGSHQLRGLTEPVRVFGLP